MSPRAVFVLWGLVLLVLVVVVLLPYTRVAYSVGGFPLVIDIVADDSVDTESLLFAVCWNDVVAEYALETGTSGEIEFLPADVDDAGRRTVPVKCSGRSGLFGLEHSYRQSEYLVVQYARRDRADSSPVRKRFTIPAVRRPRSMTVTLP
jgi:hypothetical protein